MNTTLNMDRAGRIVLPKPVRDELQLSPGDSLEMEVSQDQIVLRPARSRGRMFKEKGVWVFDSGQPLSEETVRKTIRQVRLERERGFLGKSR
jgi:AbrB family looped-hinge helix DNA binding protein